jgi:hypothetical protein
MATRVLAERRERGDGQTGGLIVRRIRILQNLRSDIPRAVVAIDIPAVEQRQFGISDDVAARDPAASAGVVVYEGGGDRIRGDRIADVEHDPPIETAPA